AVVVAADKNSANRGVLLAMNDSVIHGRDIGKLSTTEVQAFQPVNAGAQGFVHNGNVHYYSAASVKAGKAAFDVSKLDKLPKVGIVYNHSNASDLPAKAFVENGYQGIVSAGVGNGNIYKSILDTLATAAKEGVVVVRSSRIPFGYTTQNA
ncbi:asparaginase domain-containing protein, partial [Escherichia coli]